VVEILFELDEDDECFEVVETFEVLDDSEE